MKNKKFIWAGFIMLLFSPLFAPAQNMNDVYEYNRTELLGTARYMSTAGTMSNVGADLSAIGDNPAGAAYFLTNRISFTPDFFNIQNTTDYNGKKTLGNDRGIFHGLFYTNQLGVVLPFISETNKWNKISIGFNYNKTKNYFNNVETEGQASGMQSMQDYFLAHADGVPTSDLDLYNNETIEDVYDWLGENYGSYAQHAFLAYQSFMIDPLTTDPSNNQYVGNGTYSAPLYHRVKWKTEGKKFNSDVFIAGEYNNKIAAGFTLSMHGMERKERRNIIESGYDAGSKLQAAEYTTTLKTDASGFGIKMGLIYKVNKQVKLSFAFHSPVWWEINESTTESIQTEILDVDDLDGDGNTTEILSFAVEPNVVNTYEPYKFVTPSKIIVGFSAIMGKSGFISADYSYSDWSQIHFTDMSESGSAQDYFDYLNKQVQDTYTAVHRIRVGGEFKVEDWFLRAGYLMQTSPYKNLKDNVTDALSFGLGYDFGKFEVDFALVNSNEKYNRQLFPVGLTETYQINQRTNHYALTLRMNF